MTFFDHAKLALIDPIFPELAERRLTLMDAAGIQLSVLSQICPGVQDVSNRSEATELAILSNNTLWKAVQQNPPLDSENLLQLICSISIRHVMS